MEMSRVMALVLALAMVFTVLAAFPMGASAAYTADSDFFAKLDYANNPELSAVKNAVDKRDYQVAKEELLKYFKQRHEDNKFTGSGVTEADENYGMAVLPMRNILTGPYEFDMWQAEFTVENTDFTDYEIDVTDRVKQELANGAVSFMLMAGDKQQYPVYVKSKEAGDAVAPRLEVTFGGGSETVVADNDTYISSQNKDTKYGDAQQLDVKEDGSGSDPVGANTRRAYMNFPLADMAGENITSAKLVVNAALASDCTTGPKDVLVINIGDTTWDENKQTWNAIKGNIYSYEDAVDPTWGAKGATDANADAEYHNVTARFWYGKPMAYEYLSYLKDEQKYNETHPYHEQYPGAEFGPKLVDLMDAFATQMSYGYNRTLETGERLNRWVDIVDALLGTNVFDNKLDEFVNILSFMWGDCNSLYEKDITNGSYWWSNWRIVANAGFFKAVEFLPELKDHDKFRDKVEYNVEYTLNLLYNKDMSFTEAGPSYAEWCVKLFTDCAIAAEKSGNPMSADFKTKLTYAARNAAQSFFPDGWDSNVGDSNYRDKMPEFKMIADYLNDPVLNAYVKGADDPSNAEVENAKSVLYDDANSVYMRTSWDPKETTYVSFVNNPNDGHYHPDSNQVLMYAYGKPLLVDSGRYGYSNPNNSIYTELRYASAHNTVEAEGVSMAAHAQSAEKISTYASNDLFTFAASTQHGYPDTKHTRNVLFLKGMDGLTFVADYVDGNKDSQVYRQNWHFMPSSGAEADADSHSVSTNFADGANVDLYNADAETEVRDGYFSADYGLVASSKYASFKKTGADVKFSTLIVPRRAGEEAANLTLNDTEGLDSSAVTVTGGDNLNFYVKNTDNADGAFGGYTTDAKAAFAGDTVYGLVNGQRLTKGDQVIIDSKQPITSIGVTVNGETVAITGENLTATKDEAQAVKLYAPNATSVTFNGEDVEFTPDGDYVYAVGVGSVTTVVEEEYTADKDTFVGYRDKEDGKNNRSYIQAGCSDYQNRNAYMAFDLTGVDVSKVEKAELRMTMIAQNSSDKNTAGTLHFYFMDYGDWTRDTLTDLVLDSNKMPTHTINDGTYTGYSYHTEANGGSVNDDGEVLVADFTKNLKEYMQEGGNAKFTLAMLSASGSRKFASVTNTEFKDADGTLYPGPTFVLTTTKTEGETKETKVNVTFEDADGNQLQEAKTVTTGLSDGKIYTYSAPDTVEYEGSTYYLDKASSDLSVMIAEGNTYELTARYVPAAEVKIQFTHNGDPVSENESVFVMPGSSYTYTPDKLIYSFGGQNYIVDTERSVLTVKASNAENIINVALAEITLGENMIENGSFETGTDGWTSYNKKPQTLGANWVQSSDYAKDGNNSLHVNQSQQNSWTGSNNDNNLQTYFKLAPNKKYVLTYSEYWTEAVADSNSGHMHAATVSAGYGTENHKPAAGGWSSWNTGGVNRTPAREAGKWLTYEYLLDTSNKDVVNAAEIYATIAYSMNQCTSLYLDDFSLREIVDCEIKTATVTVKYVDAEGNEIRTAETFEARVGDGYDASSYVIESFRGNKNLYTYNEAATENLTGTVAEDTVVSIVYDAEAYDGVILDLSFDDAETGFEGGLGKTESHGDNVLTDGKYGKALSLDGTGSNWLTATAAEDGSPLLTNVEEITVTFYNKVNNTSANWWPFFAASSASTQTNNFEHYIGIRDNGGLTVERYNNSGARPGNIRVDKIGTDWKLVTVVYSKDKTELYVDGQLKGTLDSAYSLSDVLGTRSVLQIGKANWGTGGEFYNGLIDEFKIYDYAMTADEIAELAMLDTATELRVLTNEDGSAALGIAFTTTINIDAERVKDITKAGFKYGAYEKDENGSYTIQKTNVNAEFEQLSSDVFRLTIKDIKLGNSARLYAARPYVEIDGKKIYGETSVDSLFNVLADSIVNGEGTSITPSRLAAANDVLAYIAKNVKEGTAVTFPGFAEAYAKLFDADGNLKAEYAKLGLSTEAATGAYADILDLESVNVEFVETEIDESEAGDVSADYDYVPEL